VIFVTLGLKFFARGMLSVSAVLIGILAGYVYALAIGLGHLRGIAGSWERAAALRPARPVQIRVRVLRRRDHRLLPDGLRLAVETVGDVSGITKGGAGREATDKRDPGRDLCRRCRHRGRRHVRRLPNTSFSQNVGLIAMTGVMSRHVVTIGALFLILCGLIPKVGAMIRTVPIEVLGGGVIVMFGMVVAAGISMLSDVHWNRRNMVIFAVALSLGLGLQLEVEPPGAPNALQHLPDTLRILAPRASCRRP
jgi:hypothetical protein